MEHKKSRKAEGQGGQSNTNQKQVAISVSNTITGSSSNLASGKSERLSPNGQMQKFLKAVLSSNLSTLDAERIVGTTRIANIATAARKRLGLTLPCPLYRYVKNDGSRACYGIYTPTPSDRELIKKALASGV